MKIGFISLGCPKNQLDTEVMLHEIVEAGYDITPEETEADIVIINTCGFIESAKKEAIDTILDVAWLKENADLKGIIVCGCLAERYKEEMLAELPEIDAVLGVGGIHDIVEAVAAVEKNIGNKKAKKYTSFKNHEEVKLGGERIITTPDYFSYLKISEGCNNRCAYCAIPSIRGKFRSRELDELVVEAEELSKIGVKELNIIAQDTTRYGEDLYGRYSLVPLLKKISEKTDIPWLRLLYCYPDKITDELVAEIRDNPKIVKYIDIPLQHISDRVLKSMRRHGDSKLIREVIAKLRREIPDIIIRTTFIVGLPGESEEDFSLLCEFVKEMKFQRLGVFTYSREEGTEAYNMDNQIDEQVKQDRYDILMREQLTINEEYNRAMIGKTIKVLCEGYDTVAETYYGRSAMDAPEIDGKVYFKSDNRINAGSFVDVKILEVIDYDLYGRAVKEKLSKKEVL